MRVDGCMIYVILDDSSGIFPAGYCHSVTARIILLFFFLSLCGESVDLV